MKQFKRILSLALSCILAAGLICTAAAAEGDIGVWVDAVVNPTANDVSQGAVSEEGGQVFLTHTYGTVNTLTSAHLGGTVTIPDVDGEAVTLKTIVAEPGCVGYATTEDGLVYTEEDMEQDDNLAYSDLGMLFCHYYDVHRDGTIEDGGLSDNDLLGNAHSRFGLYEYPNNDIALVLLTFFADDGQYWVTTQEALDKFAQLTGIKAVETVFSDVAPDAYYAQAVKWAVDNGVTNGTGNNAFSPNATVTRAEAVTFLWRAAGSPKPNTRISPFTDVTDSGAWYYQAVLWATEKKITNGVSATQFSLKTTLAYDQMLAFLCRAAGGDASGSDWSNKAVSWAKKNGLTNGISFSNKKDCPRSDVVYFLWKQLADKTTEEETSRPDLAGARAAIAKGFSEFDKQIDLTPYHVTTDEAEKLAEELALTGELGMFVTGWSGYARTGETTAFCLYVTYPHYSPKEDLLKVKEKIKQITAEAVTPGMSEYEIAKALHDWLVLNNKYDMRYYSNSLPDSAYTPYAALITGTSVCNGYATAYMAMLRYNGLGAEYVTGGTDKGDHAWNIVKVDGEWYHVDVTWDDPTPDRAGYIRYNYFLRSDKALERHFDWTAGHACTSTKYDNTTLPNTQEQARQEELEKQQQKESKQAEEIVAFCMEAMKNRPYPTEADLRAAENLDYKDCYFKINFPEGQFGEKLLGGALDKALVILQQKIPQSYPGCEADYIFPDYARIKRNDVEAELQRRYEISQNELAAHVAEITEILRNGIRDVFEHGDVRIREHKVSIPSGYTDAELKKAVKVIAANGYSFDGYAAGVDYAIGDYRSSSSSGPYVMVINLRKQVWAETVIQEYLEQIHEAIRNRETTICLPYGDYPEDDPSYYAFKAAERVRKSGYSFDGLTSGKDFTITHLAGHNHVEVVVTVSYPETTQ